MAYPSSPDNLPANHVDNVGELILALHVNRLDQAINALQGELGNLPKGSYASVKARLDALGSASVLPTGPADRDLLTVDSGGTTRWSAKAAPYNVIEAGADPTGATACSAQVQTAITSAASKGPVFVPPGNYKLQSQSGVTGSPVQTWPDNTHIYGVHGKSKFTVDAGVSGDVEAFRNADVTNGNSNITLENLEIDLNNAQRAEGGSGQLITKTANFSTFCNNIVWRNLHVHHSPGLGLCLSKVQNGVIDGCLVHDGLRDGMGIYNVSRYIRITNNRIYDCADDGIASHPQQTVLDASSTPTQDVVIANNIVSGFNPAKASGANGINISGSRRVTIANNQISSPWFNGIHLRNHNLTPTTHINIVGNNIQAAGSGTGDNSPDNGIQMNVETGGFYSTGPSSSSAVENITILGNTIQASGRHGVLMQGYTTTPITVKYVTVANNQLIGFGVNAGACGVFGGNTALYGVNIKDNIIRDFGARAVNMPGGTYVDIGGNMILGNGRQTAGVAAVALGATNRVRVHDNHFHGLGFQAYGVDWGTANGAFVYNNDFQGHVTGDFAGSPGSGASRQYLNVASGGTWLPATAGTFV